MSRGLIFLYGASLLVHVAVAVGLGRIKSAPKKEVIAIALAEAPKKNESKKKNDPPPPPPEPARLREKAAPTRAKTAPSEPAPLAAPAPEAARHASSAPVDSLPDFGLSLGGATGGPGLAVPASGPTRPASSAERIVKRVQALAPPKPSETGCDEPPSKPKLRNLVQPAYPTEQRASNIEGKVRVEVQIDDTGRVASVRLISGLGRGFDDAALEAVRHGTFEPAMQCGKAITGTLTLGMRFTL